MDTSVRVEPVTLNLPKPLYERIKRRAEELNRTVEDELVEVIAGAMPIEDELPAELEATLAQLETLDDKALWRAAQSHLSKKSAAKLQSIHFKVQRGERLTEMEKQTEAALIEEYERKMLIRAHAVALLKQRGHDISVLLKRP